MSRNIGTRKFDDTFLAFLFFGVPLVLPSAVNVIDRLSSAPARINRDLDGTGLLQFLAQKRGLETDLCLITPSSGVQTVLLSAAHMLLRRHVS